MKHMPRDSIPPRLNTPPTSSVRPPVQSRTQELPFSELSWEDFEKLCLRLVRTQANLEYCRLYGVRGQEQEGIDIFARKRLTEKFSVYQCKREENYAPAKIRAAVEKFLEGSWVKKSDAFYLCTTDNLRTTQRVREVENQARILRRHDIEFQPWDPEQLSILLKDHPKLVDDFFGREWVRAFCGAEEANSLGNRLDGEAIRCLRQRLRRLYEVYFHSVDPGLPGKESPAEWDIPLEDRFVELDVRVTVDSVSGGKRSSRERTRELEEFQSEAKEKKGFGLNEEGSSFSLSQFVARRRPVSEWLGEGERSIILGEQGCGKSTVLRFLTIDMLRDAPELEKIAERWGDFLPVWVPFAHWTKMIASKATGGSSLPDAMREWLHEFGEDALWPLVEKALEDERLFIVADGFDEWADEPSARIAVQLLQTFMKVRNLPGLVASRPLGFQRLEMKESGWQKADLAGLSDDQQERLCRVWFERSLKNQIDQPDTDEVDLSRIASSKAHDFVKELNITQDLYMLAQNPLTLSLLMCLRIDDATLPRDRFAAFKAIMDHLVTRHAERRRETAFVSGSISVFSRDELVSMLGLLAYQAHCDYPEGDIPNEYLLGILENCLQDPEGDFQFNRFEARKKAQELFELVSHTLGILGPRFKEESGFFHRSIQEYLAALHLSRLPLEQQQTLVDSKSLHSQWREVILALLYQIKQPEQVSNLIERIREVSADRLQDYERERLLAEIAFGPFQCRADLLLDVTNRIFQSIEFHPWMAHREALLHAALNGLRSEQLRSRLESKIRLWFPLKVGWWQQVLKAMAAWPANEEVLECIWRGLFNEEPGVQRDAAYTLAHLVGGDQHWHSELVHLAKRSLNSLARASAILALLRGWPDSADLKALIDDSKRSPIPELRLVSIMGQIQGNCQTEEDLKDLLYLPTPNGGLNYHWRDEVPKVLLQGWPKNPQLRDMFIAAIRQPSDPLERLDDHVLWTSLLEGYHEDGEVVNAIAEWLRKDPGPTLHDLDIWDLLCKKFSGNERIREAVSQFLGKGVHMDFEKVIAAAKDLIDDPKSVLISLLDSSSSHEAAQALLDRWGMEDPTVAEKLVSMAYGPPELASHIGHLIPMIIEDKDACKKRLLELLATQEASYAHFVIEGLSKLIDYSSENEIVTAVLKNNIMSRDGRTGFARAVLIAHFPGDPRVREIALSDLSARNASVATIAQVFSNDAQIRMEILNMGSALPAPLSARHKITTPTLGASW